jgi:hypothetical protein
MRKASMILALMLSLLSLALSAFAAGPVRVNIRLPFDFILDGDRLPAGHYRFEIAPPSGSSAPAAMLVWDRMGKHVSGLFVRSQDIQDITGAQLMFKCYGDQYFLSSISVNGRRNLVPMSKAEKEVLARYDGQAVEMAVLQ